MTGPGRRSPFLLSGIETEHHRHLADVYEGVCPRCHGQLTIETLKGQDYGVCERCQLAHTASGTLDAGSWQEAALWWLRDDPPPPIDPDAPVIDLTPDA